MANKNMRWILLGVLVILFFGMQNTVPKEAVADVEGQACNVDEDCPCWGELSDGTEAFGIGTATCDEGVCNIDYCFDVEPIGDWLKDNPLQWLRDNTLVAAAMLVLLLVVIFWPKV